MSGDEFVQLGIILIVLGAVMLVSIPAAVHIVLKKKKNDL